MGGFCEGKQDGEGKFVNIDKKEKDGIWKNGIYKSSRNPLNFKIIENIIQKLNNSK